MSPKETDRPFVKTRHLRQRQTDHLTKYDVVKNRQKTGISQKGCMIIVHFKKHFQSPFEDVNTDFSVAMEEFFVSQ